LFLIDKGLPNLVGERKQVLAGVLARLENKFGAREGWENEAKKYLESDEGIEWSKCLSSVTTAPECTADIK
jgi:hypothetical protein